MIKYLFLLIPLIASSATATPWNLPKQLDDNIANITFELDSTWHTVHGKTKNLTGKVWLEDKNDYKTVRADISLPVASFDTENDSRDTKMRKVMHEDQAKTVNFKLLNIKEICDPKILKVGEECTALAEGAFTINNTSKGFTIPMTIKLDASGYIINGNADLNWAEFGVEDPSILIASVDPKVKISFIIQLKPDGAQSAEH